LATRVYILIETAVGQTSAVADALKEIPMMKAADTVTGPFDIIAVAEADDLPAIGDLISDGMPSIPGIVKTITCLSVRR
jgi:DNA-binding Lrp family transcriptional regulator|tara:strand:+ start:58 stop:294 length:237 start_codon:yes stop_codon:yes gene_type:complete